MALQTMYPAMSNSPQTTLAANLSAADTSMTVFDASVLPAAPNLCTIGTDESAEVVKYTTVTGNVLSGLIRGASGTTASAWVEGTIVARDFTSYDHDTFIDNINDLDSRIIDTIAWGDITGTLADQTDLQTALDAKADTSDLGDLATQDSVAWGTITGTLSEQTDLQTALSAKADSANLGALATEDTVDYATQVDNKPTLGTLAAKDDVASNNTYYVRRNGVWENADSRYYTQTELDTALAAKAPLASPDLTGTPTAPTVATTDSSTKIATTAFVQTIAAGKADADHNHDSRYYTQTELNTMLAAKAPLASPALTGTPTAPTAAVTTDTTQIATTAFVQDHAMIHLTAAATTGTTVTVSDARITGTMHVVNAVYSAPQYVTSNLAWVTASGSVTFTGTFTGSTNIDFYLIETN